MNIQQNQSLTLSRFFWNFVVKYKWRFVGLFFTATIWSLTTALFPYLIKVIIDNVVAFKGDPKDIYNVVLMPSIVYIGLRIAISIFMRIEDLIRIHTLPAVQAEIRETMFKHIIKHSFEFFQENMSGDISNKILNMAASFERIYLAIHDGIFTCLMSFLISTIILYKTVPVFAIYFTIWFCLALAVTSYLSTRSIALSNNRAAAESAISGNIVDVFRNIFTVLGFFSAKYETSYLEVVQNKEIKAAKILEWELIKIHLFRSISTTIMLICMLVFLIEGWRYGWVTVGDFSFVSSTAFSMAHLTWYTSKELVTLYKEWGIAQQALSILKVPYTNTDLPNAKVLEVTAGKIEFENVTFRYPEGSDVFEDQSIIINPHEKVGLVGLSGSGKTTFIKLVMRFFNPQNGQIKIDGQNLAQVSKASIRSATAIIPQNPGLFNRSIAENIAYGYPQASLEEIITAAKQAHCDEFITELENGYDTIIGENGEKLSAGQRQRLAIARATIKPHTKILILDEATSALDSITEQKIQKSIEHLMQNKTAIVIAHRLSTLVHMDRILVFREGKIVEDGNHASLLSLNGEYAKLWTMQTNGHMLESGGPK